MRGISEMVGVTVVQLDGTTDTRYIKANQIARIAAPTTFEASQWSGANARIQLTKAYGRAFGTPNVFVTETPATVNTAAGTTITLTITDSGLTEYFGAGWILNLQTEGTGSKFNLDFGMSAVEIIVDETPSAIQTAINALAIIPVDVLLKSDDTNNVMATDNQIRFRDADIGLHSPADGELEIFTDGTLTFGDAPDTGNVILDPDSTTPRLDTLDGPAGTGAGAGTAGLPLVISTGDGGGADTGTGGDGGAATYSSAAGGTSTGVAGNGGNGGAVTVSAGDGGDDSEGSAGTGGNGGTVTVAAGAAGTGNTPGSDGTIDLDVAGTTMAQVTNADLKVDTINEITAAAGVTVQGLNVDSEGLFEGLQVQKTAVTLYDHAVDGGTQGTINLSVSLPDNAVVIRTYYNVVTALTSSLSTAVIGLGINTDDTDGLRTPIAINDGSAPWAIGWHEGIQDGTAANFSETTTASRTIDLTITTEDVDTGKVYFYTDYVIVE